MDIPKKLMFSVLIFTPINMFGMDCCPDKPVTDAQWRETIRRNNEASSQNVSYALMSALISHAEQGREDRVCSGTKIPEMREKLEKVAVHGEQGKALEIPVPKL